MTITSPPVGVHTYKPRGAARQLFPCRDDEVLICGPMGTGKSLACLEKGNRIALKYPNSRGLIVRKVRDTLTSTGLVTWREKVIKELEATGGVEFYGGSAEEPPQYRYTNGSKVMIGGLDKSSKIMSSDYDWIFVQEATELTEKDWEDLTTRLRNHVVPYQQLMGDCNPDSPYHWLKKRCDRGQTTVLHSRHEDNPLLFNDDGSITEEGAAYIKKLDNLTGVRKLRNRHGQWAAAEGVIYELWDEAIHLIDEMPEGWEDWTRWWSVDFGYTHPFVCQFWAEDPDGRLYRYREIFMTRRLVEDHAATILSCVTEVDDEGRVTWTEPKPRAILADHDAEDRATFERHVGLGTKAAKKSVSDGLQATSSRMRAAGDGKARIFLLRNARVEVDQELVDVNAPTCTEEEIPGYVWNDKVTKEQPVKDEDDGCDAMRYMVAERDLKGDFSFKGWDY